MFFPKRQCPDTRKRFAESAGMPGKIKHLFIGHDTPDTSEQSSRVDVAAVVFVTVEGDQIGKPRRADRRSELGAERCIYARFFDRDAHGMMLPQWLRIPELRKSRRDHTRRTFKLQRVGKCVRIRESAPCLPG